jgi:hypothetical protein
MAVLASLSGGPARGADAAAPLVVHEWGTFTVLQDERGDGLVAINSDDEPLPDFCHRIFEKLTRSVPLTKAGPRLHPRVTMRLETPVVYFHPPAGAKLPMKVDVSVAFRGGWLTEFYPRAEVAIDREKKSGEDFGFLQVLSATTEGRLTWTGLTVGVDVRGPATSEHVWVAPRHVNSAPVMNGAGEAEQYLFYRGAGHRDAPLRVVRDGAELRLHSQLDDSIGLSELPVAKLWLAEFRDGGACAFRELPPVTLREDRSKVLARVPAAFDEGAHSSENRRVLRERMHRALVEDGLFEDEAAALLNTWEASYFKSGGLRLFFLVPRAWTDAALPMKVSVPNEMVRTMVGRVEIVTPGLRETASRVGAPDVSEGERRRLYEGLGRFRNALLIDELMKRPTAELRRFLNDHRIKAYGSVGAAEVAEDWARSGRPATGGGGGR